MAEPRKSVKERLKKFESTEGPTSLPTQRSTGSKPPKSSGDPSQGENKSAPRQSRTEQKQTSLTRTTSTVKSKSTSHTQGSNSTDYSKTANIGLKNSFGLSDPQTGHTSLPGSLTSPRNTSSPSCTESVSFDFESESHTVPPVHTTSQAVTKTTGSLSRPLTSPQPSPAIGVSTEEGVASTHVPYPPSSQRPSTMYVPSSRQVRKPSKGSEDKNKPPPIKADHASRMVKSGSEESDTLHTQFSHDTLPSSPPCSDGLPSGLSQSGDLDTPHQADSLEGPTKMLTTDHHSLKVDPITGKCPDSDKQHAPIRHQLSKLSSSGSESTDRVVTGELSMSVGVMTGQMTPTASVIQGLKEENDQLRKQLEERENEIRILTELAESGLDKQTSELNTQTASGDFDDTTLENLPSGPERAGKSLAKLVSLRTSMETDERGKHVLKRGRRMSDHELGLCKQIDTLKSQLSLKETEVTMLQEHNTRKEGTIKQLQASVKQSKEIYRRGYSNTDIDDYLDKITDLTAQLSEVEERERVCRVKNAELEQQVGVYSEMKNLTKKLFSEKNNLQLQIQKLTSELKEEKSRHASTSNQASLTPLQENVDARLLSIEAHKVPELQEQVKRLKKELEDVRGYEQMAKTLEDQMIDKITEMSKKDEEIRQLKVGVQELQEQNTSLTSRIEDTPPRVTSDPSLAMQSEAYQILLQDSTAKDEQIRQLQSFKSENETLRLELEVKAQELNSKSVEAEEKLTVKDGEIQRLQGQLVHKDRLNKQLRERVTTLTVPMPTSAKEGQVEQKADTEVLQKADQVLKPGDAGKKLRKASIKIEEQASQMKKLEEQIEQMGQASTEVQQAHARIRELEQQIQDLESKQDFDQSTHTGELEYHVRIKDSKRGDTEYLTKIRELEQKIGDIEMGHESEMKEANATIAKMTSDQVGVVEHSKKQSKAILELKDKLQQAQQARQEAEAALKEYGKDRPQLDTRLRKLNSEKAKLEQDLKHRDHKMDAMQADLDRIRGERNELRHGMDELKQSYDNSQQIIVTQKALFNNQQKELGDMTEQIQVIPQLREDLKRSQTHLQQVTKQRADLNAQLELVQQTLQVYQDDFNSERRDREAAHSKVAEMETRYTHQLHTMGNELQTRTKELEVALHVNAETRTAKSSLDRQLKEYTAQIHKLQEEVQSKTQQVKQYKKQVDQFRDQVDAGQEQADMLKAQVESTVLQTDKTQKKNAWLSQENQRLSTLIHDYESRQSNLPKLLDENRDLQSQLARHLDKINELSLQNTMLVSEMDALKKGGSVVSSQAPPTRTSDPSRHNQGNRPALLPSQGAVRPPPHPAPPSHSSQASHPPQGSHPHRQHLHPQLKTHSVDDNHLGSRGQRFSPDNRPAHTGSHPSTLSVDYQRQHARTADLMRVAGPNQRISQPRDDPYHQPNSQGRFGHPKSNADPPYHGTASTSAGGPYPPAQHHLHVAGGHDQHHQPSSLPPSIGSPTHDRGMNSRQEMGGAYSRQPDIVDKDSPPSSYQSPTENVSHQSNAKSQFVNKNPGFAQSSDSYYSMGGSGGGQGRPQVVRPLATPRTQTDSEMGRPQQQQYYGGGHHPSQGSAGGRPHPTHPPVGSQGATVGHPQQESRGAEATRAPLPPQLKVHSPNIYTPPSQGQSGPGGGARYAHTNTKREETSASNDYSQSNQLDKDIDSEIRREAWKVARQGSGEESLPAEGDTIPLDPNLVCPHCGKQFRLGEIQKFRKHAASCDK